MSRLKLAPLVPYDEAIREIPEDRFVEVQGQSVYVHDQGAGPAIVLLHGFASTAHSFRELFGPLSHDFRLLAIDLNGFGYTQRPRRSKSYRIEAQADLIVEILKRKGINEVVMLGHSYGSAVSAVLAVRHPEIVKKVILISPPSEFAEKPPWYVRNGIGIRAAYFMIRALLSHPEKFRELSAKAVYVEGVLTEEISEIYRRSMLIEGLKKACFGYAKAFGGKGADSIRYEDVAQPVLIIAGEEDAVVSAKSCKDVAEKVSEGSLVMLPACGHCPPEERPGEVVAAISDFLR
ncbi:MAG: alpha/beta hydrolase [Verrucomicrobiales bacterium]|nr:alpha/beta hydrolase [Verrucomicrobiales bacterium]